eukprot:scpid32905/ scgid7536/ 
MATVTRRVVESDGHRKVEEVPADNLVSRMAKSWPPKSPSGQRKNAVMPKAKPLVAVKSELVKKMSGEIGTRNTEQPRARAKTSVEKPSRISHLDKPARTTQPEIEEPARKPTLPKKPVAASESPDMPAKQADTSTPPPPRLTIDPEQVARAARERIHRRSTEPNDTLAKKVSALVDPSGELGANTPPRSTGNSPRAPLGHSSSMISSSSGDSKSNAPSPLPGHRSLVGRFRRCPVLDVDLGSPPAVPRQSKPSLPDPPAHLHVVVPCPSSSIGAMSSAAEDVEIYEDLEVVTAGMANLQNDYVFGNSADAEDDEEVYDLPDQTNGLTSSRSRDDLGGNDSDFLSDEYEELDRYRISHASGSGDELNGAPFKSQTLPVPNQKCRIDSVNLRRQQEEEKKRKKEEEKKRKKEERKLKEEERQREEKRLKEEKRQREEEKRLEKARKLAEKQQQKDKKRSKSTSESFSIPAAEQQVSTEPDRDPEDCESTATSLDVGVRADTAQLEEAEEDEILYGEVDEFEDVSNLDDAPRTVHTVAAADVQGIDDYIRMHSAASGARNVATAQLTKTLSSTSVKIGLGRRDTEERLRSATLSAAVMQSARKPLMKPRKSSPTMQIAGGISNTSVTPTGNSVHDASIGAGPMGHTMTSDSLGKQYTSTASEDSAYDEDVYDVPELDASDRHAEQPGTAKNSERMRKNGIPGGAASPGSDPSSELYDVPELDHTGAGDCSKARSDDHDAEESEYLHMAPIVPVQGAFWADEAAEEGFGSLSPPPLSPRLASSAELSSPLRGHHYHGETPLSQEDLHLVGSPEDGGVTARSLSVTTHASHDSWNTKITSAYIAWAGEEMQSNEGHLQHDDIATENQMSSPSPIQEERANQHHKASTLSAVSASHCAGAQDDGTPLQHPAIAATQADSGQDLPLLASPKSRKDSGKFKKAALKMAKEEAKRRQKEEEKRLKEEEKRLKEEEKRMKEDERRMKEDEKRQREEAKKHEEERKREERERRKAEEKEAKERERQEKLRLAEEKKQKKIQKKKTPSAMTKKASSGSTATLNSIESDQDRAQRVMTSPMSGGSIESLKNSSVTSQGSDDLSYSRPSSASAHARSPDGWQVEPRSSSSHEVNIDEAVYDCAEAGHPRDEQYMNTTAADKDEDAESLIYEATEGCDGDAAKPTQIFPPEEQPTSALNTPGRGNGTNLAIFPDSPERQQQHTQEEETGAPSVVHKPPPPAVKPRVKRAVAPAVPAHPKQQDRDRSASVQLKSDLFSMMSALDAVADMDPRQFRFSASLSVDLDGQLAMDLAQQGANSGPTGSAGDAPLPLHEDSEGAGEEDDQPPPVPVSKFRDSVVYDVPEGLDSRGEQGVGFMLTSDSGGDHSLDDISDRATPRFSPRVSPIADDENLYDEVARSRSPSPVHGNQPGDLPSKDAPATSTPAGNGLLSPAPAATLAPAAVGPHGRPLSTIAEEAAIEAAQMQAAAELEKLQKRQAPSAHAGKEPKDANAASKKERRISFFRRHRSKESAEVKKPPPKPVDALKAKKKNKEDKGAHRLAKKLADERSKLIAMQKKMFGLGGNEEVLVVATAEHTCMVGPEHFLIYESGEQFDVLFIDSTRERELPEESWLVRRKVDGTYGYVEEINMVVPVMAFDEHSEDEGFTEVGIDIGGLEPTKVKTVELVESDGDGGGKRKRGHVYDEVRRSMLLADRGDDNGSPTQPWHQPQVNPNAIPPPDVRPPIVPAKNF